MLFSHGSRTRASTSPKPDGTEEGIFESKNMSLKLRILIPLQQYILDLRRTQRDVFIRVPSDVDQAFVNLVIDLDIDPSFIGFATSILQSLTHLLL